jgi:hypothetical protein
MVDDVSLDDVLDLCLQATPADGVCGHDLFPFERPSHTMCGNGDHIYQHCAPGMMAPADAGSPVPRRDRCRPCGQRLGRSQPGSCSGSRKRYADLRPVHQMILIRTDRRRARCSTQRASSLSGASIASLFWDCRQPRISGTIQSSGTCTASIERPAWTC